MNRREPVHDPDLAGHVSATNQYSPRAFDNAADSNILGGPFPRHGTVFSTFHTTSGCMWMAVEFIGILSEPFFPDAKLLFWDFL
ncbi:unnamed protein product [Nippostrongylus brasiliensis]|uniref:Protein kinase domain-containing protein n=1 Tax=Nippostrongylus brasiliensis TaxID=27835 RepID=A0A0N4YX60_NIPBR|nr:unnamed protein product [Nippostrongylus brasiliensis]